MKEKHTEEAVSVFGMDFGGRRDLHVFPRKTVNAQVYRDDILDAYMRPYAEAIDDAFLLQDLIFICLILLVNHLNR